jgi:imidazolonepropionase-like amidohydrolase
MKKLAILTVVVAILTFIVLAQTKENAYIIKNATIFPVEEEALENADLLIQGGKIVAMGTDLSVTENAKIIDASGLFVYPGFIDAHTHLGLSEVSAIASTVDIREMGKENPELKVAWAINPHSVHFKTSRINGTTLALVAPSGGTYPGMSALVKMDGWTIDDMLVKEVATSLINFPMSPRQVRGSRVGPQTQSKVDITSKLVEKIQEYLSEVRHYLKLRKQAEENPALTAPALNPKYEALAPVLDGALPVILSVEKAKDIELAIKFVQDEKIKAIFRGCVQGGRVADKIKQAGIPVIVDNLYTGPLEPEDGYDGPFRNVAEMAKAGVQICFSTGFDPSTGKDLTYHAARAVAFGLDRDEAIRALTINPARIFGIDDRVGSLKVGKDADLFITTGDPLDLRSEVKHLFIDGKDMDLGNWWQTLYDTWKKRSIKE